MLINCKYCVEKSRTLILTTNENTFYFALFNDFSVTDTDSIVALALKTYATIPPQVDAIFQLEEINEHFCILFTEFLELHSMVHLFERMFEFNQVRFGPNTYVYTHPQPKTDHRFNIGLLSDGPQLQV